MAQPSLPTLEEIARRDAVDDRWRLCFLRRKIALGTVLGSVALGASCVAAIGMMRQGFSWGYCILGIGGGVAFNRLRIPPMKAEETKEKLELYGRSQGFSGFYLVGGRISGEETAVEREYGQRVMPLSSLDELGVRARDARAGGPPACFFIDHLSVTGFSRDVESELAHLHEGYDTEAFYVQRYMGSVVLERLGERRMFHYRSYADVPRWLKPAAKRGSEFALVSSPPPRVARPSSYSEELLLPFSEGRVYHPHP
jgi:hypothetical protein